MSIIYTKAEERTNYISHGAGILLGALVGYFFLRLCIRNGDHWAQWGVTLYLIGMIGSYLTSTLYHAWPSRSSLKERLRQWDHAAIYWHIAGSYSPITLVALREQGFWGWGLFAFVWCCALVGTVMSLRKLKEHSNLETLCFIAMGLVILVAFRPLMAAVDMKAIAWILAEGAFYITGALFYSLHQKKFMHSVFHFFVLGGSVCHIIAVRDVLIQFLCMD